MMNIIRTAIYSASILVSNMTFAAKPVAPCPAVPIHVVSKKIIIDRTTRLDDTEISRLVQFIDQQWLTPGDRVQVLALGGITANRIETLITFQLSDYIDTPEQRARDRWQKSPTQIATERRCAVEARQALQLPERLTALLSTTPSGIQDRSPIAEGLYAATLGWAAQGREILLISDGVEHYETGRSFYGGIPSPTTWISELKQDGLLPSLQGAKVYHLAIGLSEHPFDGGQRNLRKFSETQALKSVWQAYWNSAGARVIFGEPLITAW